MKQYKIYEKNHLQIEAVKKGWSWPAFFFTWLWAMVKKLWILALCIIIFIIIFVNIIYEDSGDQNAFTVISSNVSLLIRIILGLKGNKLRESNLRSRGFKYKTTITASNPESAIAFYVRDKSTTAETPSDSWSDLSK